VIRFNQEDNVKRKLFLLTAIILSLSLFLSACGQKDIGEAKAKEIGLAYINKIFDVNETEATVQRYVEECLPENDGAVVTGDANIGTRVLYDILVANNDSQPLYEAWVVGSSGVPVSVQQGEINIVLTDAQKKKANALFNEERNWGEKHEAAIAELKAACIKLVEEKFMVDSPVIVAAPTGEYQHVATTTTFFDSFYVVLRDGTIYKIRMQWPSMQVLGFSVEHSS
jgi:hypothetical protein